MKISVITLFPEMFDSPFESSIIKRARVEKTINLEFINMRNFGIGRHKTVDDTPYGGGVGMVLKVDVVDRAIETTKKGKGIEKVVLLDPKGIVYTQKVAEDLTKADHLILICGHYEGFDERIRKIVDMEISIGDYVLSGGEIPAMVLVDSIARLIPGVIRKNKATELESFAKLDKKRLLEHPHYTRPRNYKGMEVPTVLLSGNQKEIDTYRSESSIEQTRQKRPDMLGKVKSKRRTRVD